ncbi:MAG: VOC family protein [Cyanobacteria bacterium P01_D01_bin.128]
MMMAYIQITQPRHVALMVRDLDAADWFYGKVLGLPKCDRPLNFPGIWYEVGPFQLHVMVHADAQPPLYNLQKWGRNAHIAFAIKDLSAAQTALSAAGITFQMSASGRPALFVRDPDGNVIELSES